MAMQPSKVTFDRRCTDIKSVGLIIEAKGGQVTFKASPFVENSRVDGPARWTRHIVGTDSIEKDLCVRAFDPNFAECRLIKNCDTLMRLLDLTAHLVEPRRPAE